jgi:hypothetical protein
VRKRSRHFAATQNVFYAFARAIPAFAVPVTGCSSAMAGLSGGYCAVEFTFAIPAPTNGMLWPCLNLALRRQVYRRIYREERSAGLHVLQHSLDENVSANPLAEMAL